MVPQRLKDLSLPKIITVKATFIRNLSKPATVATWNHQDSNTTSGLSLEIIVYIFTQKNLQVTL